MTRLMAAYTVSRYRPAWWLPGPHAQTIGGRVLRRLDIEPLSTERIELPDGDFVDLHESAERLPPDAPIVVVLHGLEGSSRSNYVSTVSRELARLGIRALRLNFRACSGELNRLPRFYHAGDTADLDFVLRLLRARSPTTPIGAVGFSLGGNVLLKYLGEQGEAARAHLVAAAAVSVPFDLADGTRQLERPGISRLYTHYFLRKLRRKTLAKRDLLSQVCDVDRAISARTIREYDDVLTSRLHGFDDAWHYYRSSSSALWLDSIRLPTLILHAMDDPFLSAAAVPTEAIRTNPSLVDGVTARGGHVGFVSGPPWAPVFWAEREAAHFLARAFTAPDRTAAPAELARSLRPR